MACRSSATSRSIRRRRRISARRWSVTTVPSRLPWPGRADFSGFKTIVDVGGATGNMLAAVLSQHPAPRGVLYDRPHVVSDAPALLKARGVEARVAIEQGDFFERVPAGGDAYLLSHIIHDWNEEQCLTILGHCRKVMPPDGRLLIVETVLPAGDTPHQGKVQDIVMLVFPGGQERTEAGIRLAPRSGRFPPEPGRIHRVDRERRGLFRSRFVVSDGAG